MIYNILVIKKTGEHIFTQSFKEQYWNDDLVSGFISAAFMFSQTTFGANIDTIDVGPFRVLFEPGDEFLSVAFFDQTDSIINIRQKLRKLNKIIEAEYGEILNKEELFSPDEYCGLDEIIRQFITGTPKFEIENSLKLRFIQNLDNFCSSNDEILECALISINGIPLRPKSNKELIDLSLKQMDSFWKSKNKSIDQIIINFENQYIILHRINETLVLTLSIRRNTPIGIATLLTEDLAKELIDLTRNEIIV